MGRNALTVFGLQRDCALADRIAERLHLALAPYEERDFEDGEHKARPLHDVRGHDVFVIAALHADTVESGHDKLCRLLFFCGALKDAGAARVTAVTPYLCYARKDRRTKPNDPITTRYVAAMFEAVGINQVVGLEVHDVAAFENAFRIPTVHLDCAPLLAAHFAVALRGESVVAVAPDAGGTKRAEQFRQAMEQAGGQSVGSAFVEKHRSGGMVSGTLLAGDVRGKVAVIVDDMISTGGTLLRAAKTCRAAGATRVFAGVAHGLFIGADALFAAGGLDGIVVLNTVPPFRVPADAAAARLTVLDAAEMLAQAIAALHDGG